MKHLLLTTIAAVLLVGCGPSVDIWEAARTGNIEAVKQHLAAGTDVNAKDDMFGNTPLYEVVDGARIHHKGSHKEIVELLIVNGADVNAKADSGRTPLHNATWIGHNEIAELLIAGGADVNAKYENGITHLHLVIVGKPSHREGGRRFRVGQSIIQVNKGYKKVAKLLIAAGADVNAETGDNFTPLDFAISEKQTEIITLLRKHGAKRGNY